MSDQRSTINGIYNIYKPRGWTSFDVVAKLRGITRVKKIGHAGTLDPEAEGVLVVCIGREYTRQIDTIAGTDKEYLAGMQLGVVTDSYDLEGTVLRKGPVDVPIAQVSAALVKYIGNIKQVPPMFSAKKVQGQRLYKMARKGIEVERAPVDIVVHSIEITKVIPGENPIVELRIACGKGTYVRSLCHHIGQDLGIGACAAYIVRTKVGEYTLDKSIRIEDFASDWQAK